MTDPERARRRGGRSLVQIAGVALLVLLVWLLLPDSRDPGAPSGPAGVPGTASTRPFSPPLPAPGAITPSTESGPASVRGQVTLDGAPVEATVELRAMGRTNPALGRTRLPPYSDGPVVASTRAGPDGTFEFGGLPIRHYEVTGRSESGARGWALARCDALRPHPRVRLNLLGGEGTLAGRALWGDGSPLQGFAYARVGRSPFGTSLPQVRTDEEGRFVIGGLPEGTIALCLLEPGRFATWFMEVEIPSPGVRDFVVDDGTEEFAGIVIAADTEEPIAGASIDYAGSSTDGSRSSGSVTESGADGRFTYRLPRRQGHLWVRKEGFATAQVTRVEGEEYRIRLVRLGTVTGRLVATADGSPVPGVPVFGHRDWARSETVSDEDGRFTVEVGPGARMVYAFGRGWVSEALTRNRTRGENPVLVEFEAGVTTEIVVEVVPAARVEGAVRDAAGRPVAGVPVILRHPSEWAGFPHHLRRPETAATATDDDGRFRLATLVPGFPYVISAEPPSGLPARSEELTAAFGETLRVELAIPVERWLPVLVVEKESGEPIEGASVSAVQPDARPPSQATGPDGRALVGPLGPGSVMVSARHREYTSPMSDLPGRGPAGIPIPELPPDPEEFRIELPKGYFVSGRVRNPDGTPFEGGGLGIFREGEDPRVSYGLVGLGPVGGNGEFRRGPVPPGEYQLALLSSTDRDRKLLASRTVAAGEEDIELIAVPEPDEPEPEPMVLLVRGPNGRPASGGILLLRTETTWPSFAWLRDGRHEVTGVPPGARIRVEIRKPRDPDGEPLGGIVAGPFEVRPGRVQIDLPPDDPIAGRVIGPDGEGVAGLRIEAEPVYPPGLDHLTLMFAMAEARTDKDGRFAIHAACAGRNILRLDLPPEYATTEPAVASTGDANVLIRLRAGTAIRLRVLGPSGKPATGATARASVPGRQWASRSATVDAKGEAALAGLDPETEYELTITPPPGREDLTHLVQSRWRPGTTEFELPSGLPVAGTVRDANGSVPGATVFWRDARDRWNEIQASTDGSFRLVALAGSRVTLKATVPGGRPETAGAPVTVDAGVQNVALTTQPD